MATPSDETTQWSVRSPPQVKPISPVMVAAGGALPVLTSTHKPFVTFSPPCPAEEGSVEQLWWAPGIQPQSAQHREHNLDALPSLCQPNAGILHYMVQAVGLLICSDSKLSSMRRINAPPAQAFSLHLCSFVLQSPFYLYSFCQVFFYMLIVSNPQGKLLKPQQSTEARQTQAAFFLPKVSTVMSRFLLLYRILSSLTLFLAQRMALEKFSVSGTKIWGRGEQER